jgi:hypothetical protein
VTRLKTEAIKPMTDLDYKSLGIDPSELPPLPSSIEDVGAAPPTPIAETPAVAAPEVVATETAPAAAEPPATPSTQT